MVSRNICPGPRACMSAIVKKLVHVHVCISCDFSIQSGRYFYHGSKSFGQNSNGTYISSHAGQAGYAASRRRVKSCFVQKKLELHILKNCVPGNGRKCANTARWFSCGEGRPRATPSQLQSAELSEKHTQSCLRGSKSHNRYPLVEEDEISS